MSVKYFNEDVPFPKLTRRIITNWIKETIRLEEKVIGDISFIFCSDDYLLEVNKKYLTHDYYTDIITFDYVENGIINGDIFISTDRVKENAIQFSITFEDELNRILIHGVLHLLGYKDKIKEDKTLMTFKENYYLNVLKISSLIQN